MKTIQHNIVTAANDFAAGFAASHFAVLASIRQRVIAITAKEDVKISELKTAVAIEIQLENHLHKIAKREQLPQKTSQPRTDPSPPSSTNPILPRKSSTRMVRKPRFESDNPWF